MAALAREPAAVADHSLELPAKPAAGTRPRLDRLGFGAVLALSVFLQFFGLWQQGDGNLYYAATVRSMLTGWRNFFFAAFDPGGFVSVDKPPVGFWLQAASARLFGLHGWSLVLPDALAGVAAVALLYAVLRRPFGALAATLAALMLAVTPIAVVTARNNTIDSLLVVAMLLAAWAALRAVEWRSLLWLLAGAGILGLGFNIKMLEAYLVLPALWLAYLVAAHEKWQVRVGHLALATLVLVGVSLSWAVAVDLTPASQRPWVGSSTDNSEIQLISQYNGLNRLLPRRGAFGLDSGSVERPSFVSAGSQTPPLGLTRGGPIPFGPAEIGSPGRSGCLARGWPARSRGCCHWRSWAWR